MNYEDYLLYGIEDETEAINKFAGQPMPKRDFPKSGRRESKKKGMHPFRLDILHAAMALNRDHMEAEDLRRAMYGDKLYYGWQIDALAINVSVDRLLKWGYLQGTQCNFMLSEKGLDKILSE